MARLDHININVVDGPRMVAFLEQVLGAREGARPGFGFPGHWVYLDDSPAIHLNIVEREGDYPEGMINHVAFGVFDYETAKARVEACGYPHKLAGIPDSGIGQFFVTGPEGILIEVQFHRAVPTI